jgi:ubiquinone/menaquinone biosynthesis C-methylase UbiE
MESPAQAIVTTNEHVTGLPGVEMLRLANITQQTDLEILDLACGGGIISSELVNNKSLNIKRIIAADLDDQMLTFTSKKRDAILKTSPDSPWSRVETQKMSQTSLPLPDTTFDYVFNNFGIFFHPDENATLTETLRVLRSNGIAGLTSWKAIAWWAEVADPALAKYLPEAPKLPAPGGLFPTKGWNDPTAIPAKLQQAGFRDVRVSEYKFKPRVEAEPFAQATGFLVRSIAKRVWSEDVYGKFGGQIERALVQYLKAKYEGGVWDGDMTAIITLGSK